jgi:hypothetical protein
METVDRIRTAAAVYPALRARRAAGVGARTLANAVTCAADGYPFPTNLDLDPSVDGLTPLSQAELLHRALAEDWDADRVEAELGAYASRRRTH